MLNSRSIKQTIAEGAVAQKPLYVPETVNAYQVQKYSNIADHDL